MSPTLGWNRALHPSRFDMSADGRPNQKTPLQLVHCSWRAVHFVAALRTGPMENRRKPIVLSIRWGEPEALAFRP